MKINKLSKKEREIRRHRYLSNWHKAFAWKPIRINQEELVWLEEYYRKAIHIKNNGSVGTAQYMTKEDYIVYKLEGKE
jgi:hypothetical protein